MPGPRQDLRRALNVLAFGQAGYFTAAQALTVGYTYQAQKHHADTGNWVRVDRGLFRLPEWPPGAGDTYVRWCLWSGQRAVISHESALRVHGLSDVDPPKVHLAVPPGFAARDDLVVLHHTLLTPDDWDARPGWRVTTPLRTLVDAADGPLSQETIDGAVTDALRLGLTTRRRLLRRSRDAPDRAALRLERALVKAEADA